MRVHTIGALVALALIAVPPAYAAQVRVPDAKRQFCATRSATGEGIARRAATAPADGVATARLSGPASSDWDLALIDRASGQVLNGSAGFGSDEFASTWVRRGQELVVQACRRTGGAESVDQTVEFIAAPLPSRTEKVKLVRVPLRSPADRERLGALGLDTADHAGADHWDVVIHSAADERLLRQAGFVYDVRIADVLRRDRTQRVAERRAAAGPRAADIPSGRTQYRTLPEHQEELKALAQANPGLVRTFTLPVRSLEGRDISGIEIAENVDAPPDGRPAYIQMGTHHAREWPANEATIEFGRELIDGYKRGDPRLSAIVRGARTYVVPVVNVDGFDATIEAEGLNPDGSLVDPVNAGGSSGNDAGLASGAYKRKNCRAESAEAQATPCVARTWTGGPLSDYGVDPNRNYGVEWGGPGTSSSIGSQVFHGAGPFSEPETEAVRQWARDLQPTVLITNHTYTGLILRPPGTNRSGPTPDEDRMRTLGDAMAAQTDYVSQYSYQLYDTTGTTDDYIYDALGGFSFTPEIGKVEFHPAYTEFIGEYDGRTVNGQKLGGLREAFTLAGLTAINADSHSVLRGTAPAGRTLRITKTVGYRTSDRPNDNGIQNPVRTVTEPRTSTLQVPASGRFEWHVNPSSQPRSGETTPWRLECADGARVIETRDVFVSRGQALDLALACGGPAGGTGTAPTGSSCVAPDGFRSVTVTRRRHGLRIRFARKVRNPVTVEIFQTSIGRRKIRDRRVARFTNRARSLNWSGRTARRDGTYSVRLRILDAARRADVRRATVRRRHGRFTKRATVQRITRCR